MLSIGIVRRGLLCQFPPFTVSFFLLFFSFLPESLVISGCKVVVMF